MLNSKKTNYMQFKTKFSFNIVIILIILLSNHHLFAQKVGTLLADSLIVELEKVKADTSKVNINNAIAQAVLGTNPELSRKFATDALNLSKKNNWKLGIANSLNRIGNTYWISSNPNKAFDYYQKALIIFKELNYKIGIATATGNIGLIYAERRQDSLAVVYYKEALNIDKSINNLKGVIRHQLNLGVIYSDRGNYKTALDYYFESLKYTLKSKDKINEGIVLGNIGNIYNKLNKNDKAIEYYFKAIEVNKKNKYDVSLAYNYNNLAGIYYQLNDYDKAQFYNEKIIKLQNIIGDKGMVLSAKSALTFILINKKLYNEAINIFKEIELDINLIESNSKKSELYLGYGNLYLSKVSQDSIQKKSSLGKEIDLAIKYLELAKFYMDTTQFSPINSEIFNYLYQVYQFKGNYFKSLQNFKKYKIYQDSIFSKVNRNSLVEFESKLELELKNKQLKIKELEIEKAKANQLFTIIALVLVIALLITFIYLFTANLKKTKLLEVQNIKINDINQTKDKLFAIIAHDLINPVSNFKNVTQVLHDLFKELDEAEQLEYLSLMKDSSEGLLDMLKNLLEWSHIQRGQIDVKTDTFPLLNIINQNFSLFKVSATNKSIKLHTNITDENLNIIADYNLFTTTVRNIISNAIKYTPEGGEILIINEIINVNNQKQLELRIKDSGIGISKEKIDKLFNLASIESTPGTHNEKGTGLGLLLCKDFMELQNGTIRIESEEGQGTTLILTIPAA